MEKHTRSTRRYVTERTRSLPPTLSLRAARPATGTARPPLVTFRWTGLNPERRRG